MFFVHILEYFILHIFVYLNPSQMHKHLYYNYNKYEDYFSNIGTIEIKNRELVFVIAFSLTLKLFSLKIGPYII